MVILWHNLGNNQVSVYRTIGPTLVYFHEMPGKFIWKQAGSAYVIFKQYIGSLMVNTLFEPIICVVCGSETFVFKLFLSHLLIARCDIEVQLSVRSSVRPSTIYVKVLTL